MRECFCIRIVAVLASPCHRQFSRRIHITAQDVCNCVSTFLPCLCHVHYGFYGRKFSCFCQLYRPASVYQQHSRYLFRVQDPEVFHLASGKIIISVSKLSVGILTGIPAYNINRCISTVNVHVRDRPAIRHVERIVRVGKEEVRFCFLGAIAQYQFLPCLPCVMVSRLIIFDPVSVNDIKAFIKKTLEHIYSLTWIDISRSCAALNGKLRSASKQSQMHSFSEWQ